jgi:predicted DCC family thiol-disulfide oxidoreductase YuxK
VKKLYVLFDSRCRLCSRAAFWIRTQPAYLKIETIAACSHRLPTLFPGLRTSPGPEELVVIADSGEVYRGLSAWLMCLYALRRYRAWALRLARPGWRPFARRAVAFLSDHRQSLSAYVGTSSAFEEMLEEARASPAPEDSCTTTASLLARRARDAGAPLHPS